MRCTLLLAASLVFAVSPGGAQQPRDTVSAIVCDASTSHTTPAPRLTWRGSDVRWSEWPVSLGASRVKSRIIVVLIDAARFRLSLDVAQAEGVLAPWTVDVAPADVSLALNAGQFTDEGPWGWVVHRGREWQSPGSGRLAGAFLVDRSGRAHVVAAEAIAGWKESGTVVEAVQSYPMLLASEGRAPSALCGAGGGVNLTHRDTRLAIGVREDGQVIIALSRYDGAALPARTPIGPTTPEMAEIMRRLGASAAVMLDGGLSAQMLVRPDARAAPLRWPGLRSVPLALVARPAKPEQ